MKTYELRISTPDGKAFSGPVEMLAVRGIEGDLAVMAGHIPLVTATCAGTCRIYARDKTIREAKVANGLLAVSQSSVNFLTDRFQWLDEVKNSEEDTENA